MGAAAESQPAADDAQRIQVEVPDGGAEVAKALEHVDGIVQGIIKALPQQPQANDGGEADVTKDGGEADTDTEKAVDVEKTPFKVGGAGRKLIMGQLKKAGLEGDALEKATEEMAKQMAKQFEAGKKPPFAKGAETKKDEEPEGVQKNADGEDAPLTMDMFAEAVLKAKQFTPGRIAKLKEALDILKLVIESVQPNMSPATRTPGNNSFGASGVRDLTSPSKQPVVKSEDAVAEALKGVADVLKSLGGNVEKLNERVEAIEKVKTPSNSIEDDGGTEDNKVEKGFWSGVL